MPIHFIDNYPKKGLDKIICKDDGNPLFGEIWVYEQFMAFNSNDLLKDESWYVKHNYNLSLHPASRTKIEGQIDFLILSRSGLLILEVKGGGIRVDENDTYYSYNRDGEYICQDPFKQAKEYVHTLKALNESSNLFVYRAIVFPHECGFQLKGNQLVGYKEVFFSKRDIQNVESDLAQNKIFFEFIHELGKRSRKHNIKELHPSWNAQMVNDHMNDYYPSLSSKELNRLRSELFPVQTSFGYNPTKINSDLILNENYEIFMGLKRNQKVMVQGGPGTGKTVLAQKYLAENALRQQKALFVCANKLIKAKLEYLMLTEYELDPSLIRFIIYSETIFEHELGDELDMIIFDEAQEYYDKGLYELIDLLEKRYDGPRVLILYDHDQSIISNFKDLIWYTDFFIRSGYTHFYFDHVHRCIQNSEISTLTNLILKGEGQRTMKEHSKMFRSCIVEQQRISVLDEIGRDQRFTAKEKIVLIVSHLLDEVKAILKDYFKEHFEELEHTNINITSQKIRFSTPLKYRGLENRSVYLITDGMTENNKVQNFVGASRAIESLSLIIWK